MLNGGSEPQRGDMVEIIGREEAIVGDARGAYGRYQAIRYDAESGVFYGASESRKDGQAAGY